MKNFGKKFDDINRIIEHNGDKKYKWLLEKMFEKIDNLKNISTIEEMEISRHIKYEHNNHKTKEMKEIDLFIFGYSAEFFHNPNNVHEDVKILLYLLETIDKYHRFIECKSDGSFVYIMHQFLLLDLHAEYKKNKDDVILEIMKDYLIIFNNSLCNVHDHKIYESEYIMEKYNYKIKELVNPFAIEDSIKGGFLY